MYDVCVSGCACVLVCVSVYERIHGCHSVCMLSCVCVCVCVTVCMVYYNESEREREIGRLCEVEDKESDNMSGGREEEGKAPSDACLSFMVCKAQKQNNKNNKNNHSSP